MKVIAKKNRELALINAQNTQNENRAETITLVVPEEYEDYNKKIVFVTDDGIVWDIIQDNTYKLTNAITKYDKVDFYIWLTKEVDGESIDFRTKTKTLSFYHNEDASDEITDEEIHGVNTVANLLEEEIEKVENLNIEATKIGDTTTVTITKKDGTTESVEINDGQDGYTPQKGIDYFTEQDIEEIENGVKNDLQETVLVDYSLITETGSKIELSINTTNYKLTAILKDKNNATICTSNEIDLPLETMVVNATYDNTTKKIILTLQNGTTVEFSVADLVSGLVSESQLQTILANYYTKTEINNLLANKVDKVAGKGLSTNDFTDEYKEQVDTNTEDIEDIQDEQTEQNTEIEKLQTENARFKATLPTTGEVTGQDITLDKTAELEFKKPPLPMGNSEQDTRQGYNELKTTRQYSDTAQYGVTATTNSDGTITLNGTATTATEFKFKLDTESNELLANQNYMMTSKLLSGTASQIMIAYTLDGTVETFTSANKDLGLSSTSRSIKNIRIFINSGTTYNNAKIGVALYKGTTAKDYEPYGVMPSPDYPSEIHNVTGDVEVVVENKNLFDKNNMQNGFIPLSGDYPTSNPSYPNARYYLVPVKANDSVAISGSTNNFGRVRCIDNVSNQVIGTISTSENDYYTSNNNYSSGFVNAVITAKKDIILAFMVIQGTDTLDTFQVEYGSTATTYTPHQQQTFIFPLGNEKLMLGDYLADDGIHHVRGQKIYIGTEGWWEYSSLALENTRVFVLTNNIVPKNSNCLSNYFNTSITGWGNLTQIDKEILQIYSDKTVYIRISKDRANNLTDFKTWLSTHNTTVEYKLEQEVIVPYTSAQQEVYNQIKQAISYEEQTNISSNQNALFDVEAYLNSKVILAEKYVKPDTGIPKTDLASDVQTSLGKADTAIQSHQDISGKQNITDNTLTTINKTVPTAINEVNSIAKLANQAKSYSTYQAFINYLNTAEKTEFIPGQSFMIQTKLIPDLWVYSVENTSVQYTYTTDEDFITYTNQATGGQVGYYKLAQLETQKVDLTDYATKTYVNNLFNSIVDGDEVSY